MLSELRIDLCLYLTGLFYSLKILSAISKNSLAFSSEFLFQPADFSAFLRSEIYIGCDFHKFSVFFGIFSDLWFIHIKRLSLWLLFTAYPYSLPSLVFFHTSDPHNIKAFVDVFHIIAPIFVNVNIKSFFQKCSQREKPK